MFYVLDSNLPVTMTVTRCYVTEAPLMPLPEPASASAPPEPAEEKEEQEKMEQRAGGQVAFPRTKERVERAQQRPHQVRTVRTFFPRSRAVVYVGVQ